MAITLFSVYAPPNHKVTPDIYFLIRHPLIILGDFNGHHTSWGLFNDLKGKHLFYFIEDNNIVFLNSVNLIIFVDFH